MPRGVPHPRRGSMIVRCAWCGRVKDRRRWIVPTYDPNPDTTSHGICPDCFRIHTPAGFGGPSC